MVREIVWSAGLLEELDDEKDGEITPKLGDSTRTLLLTERLDNGIAPPSSLPGGVARVESGLGGGVGAGCRTAAPGREGKGGRCTPLRAREACAGEWTTGEFLLGRAGYDVGWAGELRVGRAGEE